MSATLLLPWLGFGVVALGLAATWYKTVFIDRRQVKQGASNASVAQDVEERKQVLATAQFFSEQVPALQSDNIALRDRLAVCEQRTAALEAAAAEANRVLLVRHAEELTIRDKEIARLVLRLSACEQARVKP